MADVTEIFGKNLRRLREARGMARALLAEKVGVSDQMIYAYETAAHLPRADVFMAICTEFGVRPRDMLAEDDVENGPSAEEALRSLAKHFGYRLVRI